LDVLAVSQSEERARFLRPEGLPGVEALHARFVHHRYAPHVHDFWVIACIDDGAVRFELEGEEHIAPTGTAFVIPPGAVHTGQSATTEGYVYRVLYVDAARVADADAIDERAYRRSPVVEDRRLLHALRRSHELLALPGHALEQGEAMATVWRCLPSVVSRARARRAVHPAVARTKAFIEESWRDNFTVRELADAVDVSPFHLVHIFHRDVGLPPSAYRRALRVLAAQRMLRRGEPVRDVALSCGFYDQAHLTRHFKSIVGVTPARYAELR
jgi:AraC-like DNA-binding protein